MMSREDFREASRIQGKLRGASTIARVRELLTELMPILGADELLLTLPDPHPQARGAIRVWAHPCDTAVYEAALDEAPDGNPFARALRQAGLRTACGRELLAPGRGSVFGSESVRRLLARTGMRYVLATRLERHDCAFGHVTFLKRAEGGEFGDDELHTLGSLNADLTDAAQAALGELSSPPPLDEVAIVDERAGILFTTPAFTWLWAAISGGRRPRHRLDLGWMVREGTAFHTQVASAIVSIGLNPDDTARARQRYAMRVPYSRGSGYLMGLITVVSGGGFGYSGSVVRIALRPDLSPAAERHEVSEG